MKNGVVVLVALIFGLTVVVAAFFFLDFHLMQSQTAVDSQIGTARGGESDLTGPPLIVYIEGPEAVEQALGAELVPLIDPYFSEVSVVEEPVPDADTPVLILEVPAQDYLWTPVYARAALTVEMAFASDGEVVWTDLGEVNRVFTGSAVRTSGTLALADTSTGIISRPAYQGHLGEQIARKVSETLIDILQNSEGS